MYTYDPRLLESITNTPQITFIMGGVLCACIVAEILFPWVVGRYEVHLESIRTLEKQARLKEMILMKEVQNELESEMENAVIADAMKGTP